MLPRSRLARLLRADTAGRHSLDELNASVAVPRGGPWWRTFAAYLGPGYMVSVGYMDPGNWATDIAGGSRFGYLLLSVILLSSLMAVVLQGLAARLGIATGMDLAQACRARCGRPVGIALWLLCEAAIVACDIAEVIGTAIALKLLFGLPLALGTVLAVGDALLVLYLMNRGFRRLEAFIVALLSLVFACFAVQIAMAAPPLAEVLAGFVPQPRIVTDPDALYLAIGIVGATVMPHNLYLHSSIVQTRAYPRDAAGKRSALRWATVDVTVALLLALCINAAILILAAAAFHAHGHTGVTDIEQAYQLIAPILGAGIAATLFAVALLASGIDSTVTATLAGQIVMEGFLHLRIAPWARRLITRLLAAVPVIAVTLLYGEQATARLLIFSQVLLSMQLPFAVLPLVWFCGRKRLMGELVAPRWLQALAWLIALAIIGMNVLLLAGMLPGH